jgi:predicted nucleic acid-binding protein
MIVVDANIILYAVVTSAETELAERVARRDPDWLVPPLWRYEVINALTTLARNKVIRPELAERAMVDAEFLVSAGEAPVDQMMVLRTALRFGISGYDAQYIALAQTRGVLCVSADGPLVRKTSGIAISPAHFIAGP